MTDFAGPDTTAAASPYGEAAAASSRRTRALLDAALARAIAALAHDLRNALGVVSMQVEVIAVRAAAATPDVAAIAGSAGVAADHIERLAAMTNALIAFARGRTSSDLSVIVAEVAALVPMRPLTVATTSVVAVDVDPLLTRAVVLELLVLALASRSTATLAVASHPAGATLGITIGAPLVMDETMEWVVQFKDLGGRITPTDSGASLQFPPIA